MTYLTAVIPGLMALYFLVQARRNLAVICALPLLLHFGRSAFLDTYEWSRQIGPVTIVATDLIFAGLVPVWILIRSKRPHRKPITLGLTTIPMLLVLALVLIEIATTWMAGFKLVRVVQMARYYAFIPISYLLWIDLMSRFTQEEAWGLVRSLAVASTLLLGLYILSAFDIPVYPYPKYQVIDLGTSTAVRDFLTFAPFAPAALAYYLVLDRRTLFWFAAVAIIVTAMMLTFTRSIIVPAIVCAGISTLFMFTGGSRPVRSLALAIGTVLAVAASFVALNAVSPDMIALLLERMGEIQSAGASVGNLVTRFDMVAGIAGAIGGDNPLFGAGMTPYDLADPSGTIYRREWILGDIMWSSVLLYFGWAGIIIFGGLLLITLAQTLKLAFGVARDASMGRFLLLVLAQLCAVTITGDGFLDDGAVAGLWFALVAIEWQQLWANSPHTVSFRHQLQGVSGTCFTLDDEYWLLRRAGLAAMVLALTLYITRLVLA